MRRIELLSLKRKRRNPLKTFMKLEAEIIRRVDVNCLTGSKKYLKNIENVADQAFIARWFRIEKVDFLSIMPPSSSRGIVYRPSRTDAPRLRDLGCYAIGHPNGVCQGQARSRRASDRVKFLGRQNGEQRGQARAARKLLGPCPRQLGFGVQRCHTF